MKFWGLCSNFFDIESSADQNCVDDFEIYFNCNALMYKPRVGDWFSSNIDDANWPSIYSYVLS